MVLQNATAEETSIDTTFGTTAQNLKKARSGKRKTKEEMVAPFAQEIKELKDLAKYWESRAMGGAEGDLIMWKAAAEELRVPQVQVEAEARQRRAAEGGESLRVQRGEACTRC